MESEIQRLIAKHRAELQSERDKAQDHTRYPPHLVTPIRLSCICVTNVGSSILLCCLLHDTDHKARPSIQRACSLVRLHEQNFTILRGKPW